MDGVFALCSQNELFYRFHPPFVTKESILRDMQALPPGKNPGDKFYVGFFQNGEWLAVMDLIAGYPAQQNAFIGFFMMEKSRQGKGTGSQIIRDCAAALSRQGFQKICLAVDSGNPQSEAFWRKNGFLPTKKPPFGTSYIPMERML